jgi:hypothetical protein
MGIGGYFPGGKAAGHEAYYSPPSSYILSWYFSTKIIFAFLDFVGQKVIADKTKYMLMSRRQNAGHNHNVRTPSRAFESLAKCRCLGSTETNENCTHEEMESRLNSENALYRSVQNLLFSRLLSTNIKVQMYKALFLPVVLDWYESWSLTLGEEHRMWVWEQGAEENIWT